MNDRVDQRLLDFEDIGVGNDLYVVGGVASIVDLQRFRLDVDRARSEIHMREPGGGLAWGRFGIKGHMDFPCGGLRRPGGMRRRSRLEAEQTSRKAQRL